MILDQGTSLPVRHGVPRAADVWHSVHRHADRSWSAVVVRWSVRHDVDALVVIRCHRRVLRRLHGNHEVSRRVAGVLSLVWAAWVLIVRGRRCIVAWRLGLLIGRHTSIAGAVATHLVLAVARAGAHHAGSLFRSECIVILNVV